MKRLFLIPLLFVQVSLFAQEIPAPPNPPRLVNDFADLLSPAEEASLERKLVAFSDSTSTQIAIVTVKSIGDYEIADFAISLGQKWGVGGKGKNNGAVVLVSLSPRKSFISTGYGLEGSLPDATLKQITTNTLNPLLAQGQFFSAFDQATDLMMKYTTGEFKGDKVAKRKKGKGISAGMLFFLFLIFIFIVSRARSVQGNHMGSGGLGWLTALFLLGNMGGGSRNSGWNDFSSGGGDFGGFGGGDFGGGGAGGDW